MSGDSWAMSVFNNCNEVISCGGWEFGYGTEVRN